MNIHQRNKRNDYSPDGQSLGELYFISDADKYVSNFQAGCEQLALPSAACGDLQVSDVGT